MPVSVYDPPALAPGTLRVTPIGGLGEIGRNMTTYEIDGKLLIVDCGVLFPEENEAAVIEDDIALVKDIPGVSFDNFRPDRNAAAGGALPKVAGTTR